MGRERKIIMSSLIQQTDEWLEMRKNKIGASDAPVIMEVSPWKTPYQLWEEKIGIRSSIERNLCMQRGIELEEKARSCFESMTKIMVFPRVIMHPTIKWMMASLDGIDIEQKYIVEIKCPGRDDHELAKSGKVPEKYYPQLQHQMEVTGLDSAFYFSFDGEQGALVEVRRCTRYIDRLLEEEEKFYRCMVDFLPPELKAKDYEYKEDPIWKSTAKEWIDIQEKMEELTKKEREIRNLLISMGQGQNSIGGGIKMSKILRKGNIDYTAIPNIANVDLDKYRKKPVECWRITKE